MAFRFLHLADLHLDTVFGGREQTRDHFRAATFEAFERAVELAIREQLHAVLAAGDLYDDGLLSLRSEVRLRSQVQRLSEAGVWFLACCGNHDPGGPGHKVERLGITLDPAESAAPDDWRRRVHVFRNREPETVRIHDRAGRAVGIVVGAGHPTSVESADLAAGFPRLDASLPVVGLLHTQVAGARASDEHARYAPSSPADFERSDYSYWALGHVHVRGRAVSDRPVYYAGNLQGRNPKETGAKGGYLVEAHAGAPADPEFVSLAPARWERLELGDLPQTDVTGALVDHIADRVAAMRGDADGRFALRCVLTGPSPLALRLREDTTRDELASELAARTGALEVQIRAAGLRLPFDRGTLRGAKSVVSTALELIDAARSDPAQLDALAPDALQVSCDDDESRAAHLALLLEGLDEELIQRSIAEDRS